MKSKIKVLVFPSSSEIANEIYNSVKHSIHFELIGSNSVDDGKTTPFLKHTKKLPSIYDSNFLHYINEVIQNHDIDLVYPAMDSCIEFFKKNESDLACKVVGSSYEVSKMCLSKSATYNALNEHSFIPKFSNKPNYSLDYPCFAKPDIGYGSRGIKKIASKEDIDDSLKSGYVFCEYLPGKEYTVDCFTDRNKKLLFIGARERVAIKNGISVHSRVCKDKEFDEIALAINNRIGFRGAWFFQVKEDQDGKLKLLEVAARLGGSSGLYRNRGINFALATLFDFTEKNITLLENSKPNESYRNLITAYKLKVDFKHAYFDYDDTVIIDDKVYLPTINLIYDLINHNVKVVLITRHNGDLKSSLTKNRLSSLFDDIIHIKDSKITKSSFIHEEKSIFIDDSFIERQDVFNTVGCNVFSPDMVDSIKLVG
ncbi:ATP-grasp domain-containing protein [Vibrio coralliirubri]|uniref:ATP-grasp domain-containing protein n=1 Tax=Vibrio coralliirubri TaxID=1516159 RepID=UPI002FE05034